MTRSRIPSGRPVHWRRLAVLALVGLGLLLPTGGPSTVTVSAAPLHAEPALLQLAATRPATPVQVIVQRQGHDQRSVDWLVKRLGGHVTHDLSIINAFTATLPAGAVPSLAATSGVRWISLDGAVVKSSYACCSASTLQQVYDQAIGAAGLWNGTMALQGQGVGVAVVDSGINYVSDLANIVARINVNPLYHHHTTDLYGHGTHVAGIIASNGALSNGANVGVAPQANLLNVRVADDNGQSTVSDVVNGLQWVYNNQAQYNIRVVNLSLNSTVADSYQVDPLDAAVETLWNAGIVVVASAGNTGSTNAGTVYAPADDPFIITVGAVNDQGTVSTTDDALAGFSSYGTIPISTTTGLTTFMNKPDLVAPGVGIISDLAGTSVTLAVQHPANVVASNGCTCFFSMSGTSMAAPMVSGAVALLLQANPNLTPNQVKYRLMATASPVASTTGVGAGEVNVAAAVASTSTASANANIAAAASIQPGNPAANWGSANWGSANWGSANWGSANWGSANWGSVSWGSVSWGSANWGSDYWGS